MAVSVLTDNFLALSTYLQGGDEEVIMAYRESPGFMADDDCGWQIVAICAAIRWRQDLAA